MGLELLRSTSASNSVFRVVCGEMVLSDKQNLHNEAVFGHVREGVLGISIDDHVKMYLKEIGKVNLLDADEETELRGVPFKFR